MKSVDVLTVGAGGGAYPAAFRLGRAGRRVVMVDPKGVMSGNCLAEGCVPSKSIREVAGLARRVAREQRFGSAAGIDYAAALAHKHRVQTTRYAQHARELERFEGRVELVKGTARLVEPHVVEVQGDAGAEQYRADHIIVASGADAALPPIPGAELCLTSHDLFALTPHLTQLPARMVIVGAGYIGLEAASFLAVFGVRVQVLEMLGQALPGADPDFAAQLVSLLDPAIELVLRAQVERIDRSDGLFRVHYRSAGQEQVAEAEQVLMAAGRRSVIPQGAEALGLKVERGRLRVNDALQTRLPHVYGCGDVNGRAMLFHAAVRQSLVAAHNILGGDAPLDFMDFGTVPTTIFTFPEAAFVGVTRSIARVRGLEVRESAYAFADDSRAQILDETGGELRLFFAAGSLRLLGGWVIGVDAGNLIGEIGLAVAAGLDARDLARFPDQHPMASEGISHAARSLF